MNKIQFNEETQEFTGTCRRIDLTKNFGGTSSKRNKAIRELTMAYQEKNSEADNNNKDAIDKNPWFKKAFDGDYYLFADSSEEIIMDSQENYHMADSKYDWMIENKLRSAVQPSHSPELGEEDTNMSRAGLSQLNRQIIQDCLLSGSEIKIIQQTPVGTCSIPSMYQIDKISQFAGMTLQEAEVISKIYRILEIGFKEAVRFNKFIKARQPGIKPWDVIINNKGMSLLKLAQELKALALTPQEDPEWAHCDNGSWSSRVLDNQAVEYDADFDCKSYDKFRSEQWDQSNPVGEVTYWKLSNIPAAQHLIGHNSREFKINLSKLEAGEHVTIDKKSLAPAQKAIWNKTAKRMANSRAEFKIIRRSKIAA